MKTVRIRTGKTAVATMAGVALGVALLAGCGTAAATGSGVSSEVAAPGTAVTGGGPDPCTLLRDDEASALLHRGVTRSEATPSFRGVSCRWQTADGTGLVSLQVYRGREFFAPEEQAPAARRPTGLGDDAYVGDGTAGALVGDTVVVLHVTGFGLRDVAIEPALRSAVDRARG